MSTPVGGRPPRPTRRALLGAALVAPALAACSRVGSPEPEPVTDPVTDRDDGFRAAAAARERTLLRAYDEAMAAQPALQARLSSVRREHEEHLRALEAPGILASPSPSASALTAAPPRTLKDLSAMEASAALGHARDAVLASRDLAPVLASLAASEAAHRVVLR